jgi:hypothetical protein
MIQVADPQRERELVRVGRDACKRAHPSGAGHTREESPGQSVDLTSVSGSDIVLGNRSSAPLREVPSS